MKTKDNDVIIFDLDDTLYKEIDYLRSAYLEIAQYLSKITGQSSQFIFEQMLSDYAKGVNVFESIILRTQVASVALPDLIAMYRKHKPHIALLPANKRLLDYLKSQNIPMGLITDGRSMQQRHKLEALGLNSYFETILISEEFGTEKPHVNNFKHFENQYGRHCRYTYIGDNLFKDFISPNALGWISICLLDDGRNIHKQQFSKVSKDQTPQYTISELSACIAILNV
jgi:putative hydrolase of the HAD superfamily